LDAGAQEATPKVIIMGRMVKKMLAMVASLAHPLSRCGWGLRLI
jgi:hypothetical protein